MNNRQHLMRQIDLALRGGGAVWAPKGAKMVWIIMGEKASDEDFRIRVSTVQTFVDEGLLREVEPDSRSTDLHWELVS